MAIAAFRELGRRLPYTPPTTPVAAGQVLVVGAIVGIATEDIAVGEQGTLAVDGVFEVTLYASDTPAPKVGDTVYWSTANQAASVQSAYSNIMGLCWNDGTQAAGKILVKMSPFLAAAGAYGP